MTIYFSSNSLLHWQDIFAGYVIVCCLFFATKTPLFQFEFASSGIWIFLTPKGWVGETSAYVKKSSFSMFYSFHSYFLKSDAAITITQSYMEL